ncbi:transcription initiation factor TFIID subunit 10 isoform X3 [Cicer arietinum]
MNQNQPQSSSSEGRTDDDSALSDFLASLIDYTPTIPDELVEHYLAKSGFQCPDVRLWDQIGSCCHSEICCRNCRRCSPVNCRHSKARQASIPKDKRDRQQKDKRLVLTMEDLSKALREYGVNLRHQEYFADSPSTGMDPATRDE